VRIRAPKGSRKLEVIGGAKQEANMAIETLDLSEIKIGNRFRHDLGDLDGLRRSINARGLLHPVVITPDKKLIAGARRIGAWRISKFRKSPIPVTVVDIDNILAGEWEENFARKDLTPSEAVAIMRVLLPDMARASAARELAGKRVVEDKGRAGDKAAKFTGWNRRTLEKAQAVIEAAEADPKRFGSLKDLMDRTGRVNGAWKKLVSLRRPSGSPFEEIKVGGRQISAMRVGELLHFIRLHRADLAFLQGIVGRIGTADHDMLISACVSEEIFADVYKKSRSRTDEKSG
jgi:hypothetical protein